MKSKAPKAPDYSKLAAQQSKDQKEIAEYLTAANRPNQIDAFGNQIKWTKDPKTGQWTQSQIWNQDVRDQYKGQMEAANSANDLYKGKLNELKSQGKFSGVAMPTYDENSGKAVSDATYNLYRSRAIPEQERRTSGLDSQLRLQGLQPGTEAYDRAMRNMMTSNADADYAASQNATLAGYDEARQRYLAQLQGQGQEYNQKLNNYNLPWQQAQMAQGMASDRYNPQMPGFSGATGWNPADQLGAANAKYSNQVSSSNSSNQKKGSTMGAGASMFSSYMMSDEELKSNIQELDGRQALEDLLAIGGYRWTWKADGTPDYGVIAQQVNKVFPEAVARIDDHLAVNYSFLVGKCIAALGYLATQGGAK